MGSKGDFYKCFNKPVLASTISNSWLHRWGDLAYALGGWSGRRDRGTDQLVDRTHERWKPNIKVLKAVIQYIKATKRFQPRAVVVEETEGRDNKVGGSL